VYLIPVASSGHKEQQINYWTYIYQYRSWNDEFFNWATKYAQLNMYLLSVCNDLLQTRQWSLLKDTCSAVTSCYNKLVRKYLQFYFYDVLNLNLIYIVYNNYSSNYRNFKHLWFKWIDAICTCFMFHVTFYVSSTIRWISYVIKIKFSWMTNSQIWTWKNRQDYDHVRLIKI
jgi:hypothetical protein